MYDYFDFLETHRNFYGNANYLRIDISNFFGSISEQMIIDTFEYYVDSVEKEKILKCLLDVMLYNGVLIQGTPIAPVVSNIIFRSVDIRIQRYCDKQRVMYSRYVDDLMFSSEERGKLFNKDFCCSVVNFSANCLTTGRTLSIVDSNPVCNKAIAAKAEMLLSE